MNKLPIGTKYCLCPACGEYFTNVVNFDLHRVWTMPPKGVTRRASDVRCVDPEALVDKNGNARLRRNAKGCWARTGGAYMGPV